MPEHADQDIGEIGRGSPGREAEHEQGERDRQPWIDQRAEAPPGRLGHNGICCHRAPSSGKGVVDE